MEGRKKRKIKPTKKFHDCEDTDIGLDFLTKRGSSLLEISIDVNSNEVEDQKSKKRKSTRLSENVNKSSYTSVVTIHLTESLASQWNQLKEELSVSNEELLEYLLKMQNDGTSSNALDKEQQSESEKWIETQKSAENMSEISTDSVDVSSRTETNIENINEVVADQPHNEEINEEQKEGKRTMIKKYKSIQSSGTGAVSKVCNICQKVLRSGTERRIHVMSEHFTLYTECFYCLQMKDNQNQGDTTGINAFVEIQEYFNHLKKVHESRKLECPYCKASNSQSASSLRKHMLAKHRVKLLCRCNVCHPKDTRSNQKVLIKAVSLKRHLRIRHPTEEIAMGLKKSCTECGLIVLNHNMARHILNAHSDKNNTASNLCCGFLPRNVVFQCGCRSRKNEICGKHFAKLKQHNLSVHKAKEEWHFQCKQCNKRFAKRYNLQVHERLHTGERPYVCDVCGKSFCQFIELRLHSKKHLPGSKQNSGKMKANENKLTLNQQQKLLPGREIILQTTPVVFQTVQVRPEMLEEYQTPTSVCNISNGILKSQDQILSMSPEKQQIQTSQTMYAVLTELSEPVEITTTSTSVSEQLDSSFMQSLSAVLNMNADTNPVRTDSEDKFHGVQVSDVKWAENTVKDFSP